MKQYGLLFLLLPMLTKAQDNERYLRSCASLLALNRTVSPTFFFAPKHGPARRDTAKAAGPTYRFRALDYVWQRDYNQAALWFEKTATLFPKEHGAVGEFYMLYLRDYPRAMRHLNAFDALTPTFDDLINHNPVSYLRGLVYRNMGDHVNALSQFTKAIDSLEIKHGAEWVNYRHYISRAISYVATQQAEKALVDLDKAAKNFGRSALVSYHRGWALLQLGRTAEARSAFQDASFFYKALRYERTGNYQEDEFNPIYESVIDEALNNLKTRTH